MESDRSASCTHGIFALFLTPFRHPHLPPTTTILSMDIMFTWLAAMKSFTSATSLRLIHPHCKHLLTTAWEYISSRARVTFIMKSMPSKSDSTTIYPSLLLHAATAELIVLDSRSLHSTTSSRSFRTTFFDSAASLPSLRHASSVA